MTVGTAEGEPDQRGSPDAGSCTYDDINSAEACGVAGNRVYQGTERDLYSEEVFREEAEFCETAFLGQRILCFDGGSR